ncbi:MAG TPA: UDP-3-O-(3-hydroxymyristoyl)glucosamine N-acyltransferase [Candidatus Acidoferrales bacterium]|nr:UDP-3-O-(3-hydroxymyristoyl)glucosamine N-acyltransferase [Candidatus Acidoferrales bacterium]
MITARELAKRLKVTLEGDPAAAVEGLASPERARETDLIFVETAKHSPRAARSLARCVVAPSGIELGEKTILRAGNPKLAFAQAAALLVPVPRVAAIGVHATAVVGEGVKLGDGVAIGPYAVIDEGAEIGPGCQIGALCCVGRGAVLGAGCTLYPHVVLYPGTHLGRDVILHAGVVVGGDGFGYVSGEGRHWKFPQIGRAEIGEGVEIGCNSCVDRGALEETRVGAGTKIDNLVQIGHNVQIGEGGLIVAQAGLAGSSVVGRYVVIGGQVGIADHVRIEDGAIIGAQAGIPTGKRIAAGEPVWGTPARPIRKYLEQLAWLGRLSEVGDRLMELAGGMRGKDTP